MPAELQDSIESSMNTMVMRKDFVRQHRGSMAGIRAAEQNT